MGNGSLLISNRPFGPSNFVLTLSANSSRFKLNDWYTIERGILVLLRVDLSNTLFIVDVGAVNGLVIKMTPFGFGQKSFSTLNDAQSIVLALSAGYDSCGFRSN